MLGNLPVRDQSLFKLIFKGNVFNSKNDWRCFRNCTGLRAAIMMIGSFLTCLGVGSAPENAACSFEGLLGLALISTAGSMVLILAVLCQVLIRCGTTVLILFISGCLYYLNL